MNISSHLKNARAVSGYRNQETNMDMTSDFARNATPAEMAIYVGPSYWSALCRTTLGGAQVAWASEIATQLYAESPARIFSYWGGG